MTATGARLASATLPPYSSALLSSRRSPQPTPFPSSQLTSLRAPLLSPHSDVDILVIQKQTINGVFISANPITSSNTIKCAAPGSAGANQVTLYRNDGSGNFKADASLAFDSVDLPGLKASETFLAWCAHEAADFPRLLTPSHASPRLPTHPPHLLRYAHEVADFDGDGDVDVWFHYDSDAQGGKASTAASRSLPFAVLRNVLHFCFLLLSPCEDVAVLRRAAHQRRRRSLQHANPLRGLR